MPYYYSDSDYDSDYDKPYQCNCGLQYSFECTNKKCHKCCKDVKCLRHRSDTSNICKCGLYYYSLTCKNKMCKHCCNDNSCKSVHVVYYKGKQYKGTLIKHDDHELHEIKQILQKQTVLSEDIIDYTINNFLNYGEKCNHCNKKYNNLFSHKCLQCNYCNKKYYDYDLHNCEKCQYEFCKNCIKTKNFERNYYDTKYESSYRLCEKCEPTIPDIQSLYKYSCKVCGELSNYINNSCKKCIGNTCNRCYLYEHCWDCLETLTDISSRSELENFQRCEKCNHIYHYENMQNCEDCQDRICVNCCEQHSYSNFNWIGFICNECVIKCEDCNINLCQETITECNICEKKICDEYSCKSCENPICKKCTYRCNYCNKLYCEKCTEECTSCKNSICIDCYIEKDLTRLICQSCN